MSLMMPVFKRNLTTGNVEHRHIGAEQWPEFQGKGWWDAPDKVPLGPGQMAEPPAPDTAYHAPVKPYGAYGSVHGETKDPAPRAAKAKAVEKAPEIPRGKGGRFVKAA